MARTKRTSTRRTGTRKASTRRTTTKRKKTTTRRPSTRTASASSKKRSTGSRKPKGLRLSRKKQKQILIIVGVIVALLLLIGFLQSPRFFKVDQEKAGTVGEISRNAVYGKVTSINVGPVRKAIRVKILTTGKTYTFYVGWRTRFSPRWPTSGETVKVYYVYDRGYLKATRVRLQ
jgi:transglutaminase/protease-like cytokinesis protein 3